MSDERPLSWIDRGLIYWDTSLVFNWAIIPIFLGLFCSGFNLSDRVGIADAARRATPQTIDGKLKPVGRRSRNLALVRPSGERIAVTCGAYYNAASCIPIDVLPRVARIDVFYFNDTRVILSARNAIGKELVTRAAREDELDGLDQNARSDSAEGKFLLGALLGLIIATCRYFIFVRRRRKTPKM